MFAALFSNLQEEADKLEKAIKAGKALIEEADDCSLDSDEHAEEQVRDNH